MQDVIRLSIHTLVVKRIAFCSVSQGISGRSRRLGALVQRSARSNVRDVIARGCRVDGIQR
jgi:hypothetical protein